MSSLKTRVTCNVVLNTLSRVVFCSMMPGVPITERDICNKSAAVRLQRFASSINSSCCSRGPLCPSMLHTFSIFPVHIVIGRDVLISSMMDAFDEYGTYDFAASGSFGFVISYVCAEQTLSPQTVVSSLILCPLHNYQNQTKNRLNF